MSVKVVVVGSLNMDLVVPVPHLPAPGETVVSMASLKRFPGGKGANQAVEAARMGAEVVMVGKVGDDSFGAALIENLERDGVDTSQIIVDGAASTGTALIVVDEETAQNSIAVASGANMRLTPYEVAEALKTIGHFDVLVLQLEIPLEANIRAAQIAHQMGIDVVLNPAPVQQRLPEDFIALVDVLVPNETEVAYLTGILVEANEDAGKAARNLISCGAKAVVITLGKRGALVVTPDEARRLDAYQVNAVDTTAAGDAFVGALAVALAEGKNLFEAAEIGNAAGALAVTKMGAQPAMPTRGELDNFMTNRERKL